MRAFLLSFLNFVPWIIATYFLCIALGVFAAEISVNGFTPTMITSNRIIANESAYAEKNNRYQQTLPIETSDFTYRVDEYVTGSGDIGYVIYYFYSDGTVSTFGVGPDTTFRHYSGLANDRNL